MTPVLPLHHSLLLVVLDLYIDNPPKKRVWIVDFNPWGEKTDPLLYDWEYLLNYSLEGELQYRAVEAANKVKDRGLGKFKVPVV
jgi:D123